MEQHLIKEKKSKFQNSRKLRQRIKDSAIILADAISSYVVI